MTPVPNARIAASLVYPGIRITDGARPQNAAYGATNSWHKWGGGQSPAIDAAPIPGMTFAQYVQGYINRGYKIIEARDEVLHPSKHATGPHWHIVLGY